MIVTEIPAQSFDLLARKDDPVAFRAEVRAWLAARIPAGWRERVQSGGDAAYVAFQQEWFGILRDVGLHTAHWPRQWGGEELGLAAQVILYEELARADAPNTDMHTISIYHLPATLFAHGTAEQQARYLSGVRDRGEVWCQGFSEPGAGSDLAALRTRAERRTIDGRDVYVINGQKIWSSIGMHADYCMLLVRTEPNLPKKHDGISYLIVDMKTPGITRRPIEQITGEAEFTEVFYDDVIVPVENRIGAENQGWQIAMSTLTAERGILIFEFAERLRYAVARDAERGRDSWLRDPAIAREFAAFYPRTRAMSLIIKRLLDEIEADPKHGGSATATYVKLYWGVLLQDYNSFLVRAEGLATQGLTRPIRCGGMSTGDRMYDFLKSYSWAISGGSNEIMRNIIAERLLAMPR